MSNGEDKGLQELLDKLEDAGWRLVPTEPTDKLLTFLYEESKESWIDMLNHAPQPRE